jgi:hypothetical protein
MESTRAEVAKEFAEREAAIEAWQHPAKSIDPPEPQDELIPNLADVLTRWLNFIADGRAAGTMAHRAFTILSETRKDLIMDESIEHYAGRTGTPKAMLATLRREFYANTRRRGSAVPAGSGYPPTPHPVRNLFPTPHLHQVPTVAEFAHTRGIDFQKRARGLTTLPAFFGRTQGQSRRKQAATSNGTSFARDRGS